MRRSVTYVRKTGLVEGPTKNHTARTVPVPAFVARLLETEIADRDGDALVFESARGGGYLTLGQARYSFTEGGDGGRRDRRGSATRSAAHLRLVGDQRRGEREGRSDGCSGHKTAVLTLDRYGHLFPDDLDAVADAFDAAAATTADPLRTGPVLKPVHSGRNSL